MGMASAAKVENFNVYRYPSDAVPNEIGEMPAPTIANMTRKGTVNGRVTEGETVEPDILGTAKNYGQDVSTWWLGFFDTPTGFDVRVGDVLISSNSAKRIFQIQFIDTYPGGVVGHHIECKMQATSIYQEQAS